MRWGGPVYAWSCRRVRDTWWPCRGELARRRLGLGSTPGSCSCSTPSSRCPCSESRARCALPRTPAEPVTVDVIHRVTVARNFFISYLCQLFCRHVVGQALLNVSYTVRKTCKCTENQARYFCKIYGTGSVFVFSVSLRNKMRFRYFSSSCNTNGISGIT